MKDCYIVTKYTESYQLHVEYLLKVYLQLDIQTDCLP